MRGAGEIMHRQRPPGEDCMKAGKLPAMVLFGLLMAFLWFGAGYGAGPGIVLYRVGDSGQGAVAFIKQYLETKGYQVALYQGESVIEKHVEKANLINRSAARVFIAIEMTGGEKRRVMVARTEAKKGDGRFLAIDEVPERFAGESRILADAVAGSFGVKAKQMPLFPLLGISMPGIFVGAQLTETDFQDIANKLYIGMEKYFSEGVRR
jgi:hypothetical protein